MATDFTGPFQRGPGISDANTIRVSVSTDTQGGGGGGGTGTQYPDGTVVATPIGVAVLGYDGAAVQVLSTDTTGKVHVLQGDLSRSVDNVAAFVNTEAKGATAVGNPTATQAGTDHTNLDIILRSSSGTELATSGAPLRIDPTGTTPQPVTGTVTTTPPSNASTNLTQVGGSAVALGNTTTANSIPVTIASNQNTVTVTDTNLNLAIASTTAGQKGNLVFGAVTTAAPTYTTAQSNPLSLTTAGGLRTDSSGTTQPISAASLPLPTGASTAAKQPALGVAGTPSTDVVTVQGAASGTALPVSGTVTSKLQDGSGNSISSTSGSLNVNVTAGGGSNASVSTTGSAVPASATMVAGTDGTNLRALSVTSTGVVNVAAAVTTSNPTYSTGTNNPLSSDVNGGLRVHVIANDAGGSGGTSATDEANYVAGTTAGTPGMLALDDVSPTPLSENQVGIVRGSSRREMYIQIRDALGNERGCAITPSNAILADTSGNVFIKNSATLTTTGSQVVTGLENSEINVIVNVTGTVSGTTPVLVVSVQDVCPVNGTTVLGNAITGANITATNTQQLLTHTSKSGSILVTWTITGTTPSFGGTNISANCKDVSFPRPNGANKTSVNASASSVTVLAANTQRKGAYLFNDSTVNMYLDLTGGTATTSSYSIKIQPNQGYGLDLPILPNLLTAIWDSATGAVRVTEYI